MPSTDSSKSQKLDGLPLESLDAFDWNRWMTCPGIRIRLTLTKFRFLSRPVNADVSPKNQNCIGPSSTKLSMRFGEMSGQQASELRKFLFPLQCCFVLMTSRLRYPF